MRRQKDIVPGELVKALLNSNRKVAVTVDRIKEMTGIRSSRDAGYILCMLRDSKVVHGMRADYVNPNFCRVVQPLGPKYSRFN